MSGPTKQMKQQTSGDRFPLAMNRKPTLLFNQQAPNFQQLQDEGKDHTTESQLYMSMTAPCPSDTDPREQQVTYHDSGLNYTTGFGVRLTSSTSQGLLSNIPA